MKNYLKLLILFIGFASLTSTARADRGGKKPASKVLLNIGSKSSSVFGNSILTKYNNGLHYTGSAILSTTLNTGGYSFEKTSITTFQKGNTIYIQPYKQVVVVPDYKQGYGGMKVIIKPY